jgi:hypothetical protein
LAVANETSALHIDLWSVGRILRDGPADQTANTGNDQHRTEYSGAGHCTRAREVAEKKGEKHQLCPGWAGITLV